MEQILKDVQDWGTMQEPDAEKIKQSADHGIAQEIIDALMMASQVIPMIGPMADSVLTLYRNIKDNEQFNELMTEWKDDFLGLCYRMNEISVQQDIKAINAYKAAGISEDNAIVLRCARIARKLPEIKIKKRD